MKNTKIASQWILVAITSLAGLGCFGGDLPDTARVTGTVTLDGKPHPSAEVVFTPSEGRPSSGITDEAGKYELTFLRNVKGATLGEHTVRITTVPPPRSDRNDEPLFVDPLTAKYNTRTTLKATVEAGSNTHDFSLTRK